MKIKIIQRKWTGAAESRVYALTVRVSSKRYSRDVFFTRQMPEGPYTEVYRRRIEREALATVGATALEYVIEAEGG